MADPFPMGTLASQATKRQLQETSRVQTQQSNQQPEQCPKRVKVSATRDFELTEQMLKKYPDIIPKALTFLMTLSVSRVLATCPRAAIQLTGASSSVHQSEEALSPDEAFTRAVERKNRSRVPWNACRAFCGPA